MTNKIIQPSKVIDIHSHMFNLKYLPVAGIIVRYTKGIILPEVARGIEWLFLKNTGESFNPLKATFNIPQYAIPTYNQKLTAYLNKEQFKYDVPDIFDFDNDKSIDAIENMVYVGDLMDSELSLALEAFEKTENPDFNKNNIFKSLSKDGQIKHRAGLLRQMIDKIIGLMDEGVNHMRWFIFMTHSEEDIYKYITEKDAKRAEKFLFLTMDVDHFFNSSDGSTFASHFNIEEQISNMEKLKNKHDNLIGFVAFNPSREDGLDIVKKAIKVKGFKGVKFYPPLGYRANNDPHFAEQIEELIKFCVKENVPLFTHCNNQGFEAWPGDKHSGYNSNPVYWEQVLEKYPTLILCLGHAGGTEGWFSENKDTDIIKADDIIAANIKDDSEEQKDWNKSYASMVFKLCVKYTNVYCDASYLDDMINSNGNFEKKPRENFKTRLLKLFKSEPKFSTKIMYGSDWHMLFREAKNGIYLDKYLEFFTDAEFDDYREQFFFMNAESFLNSRSNVV